MVAHHPSATERLAALDRGISLLQALSDGQPRTVSQIAADLVVSRPVVYRMLNSFGAVGWVTRDHQGRYRLGVGLLRVASGVLPGLRSQASPVLQGMAESLGATAHLTLAEGYQARAVLVVEPSWTDWHVAYRVGSQHPLGQGAAGRAILAGRQGVFDAVTSQGELQPGAVGVAAPVCTEALDASIGVVAMGELDVERAREVVYQAAQSLRASLR